MTYAYNGGPAFAHGNHEQGGDAGMSLRDWFAGQALAEIIATCSQDSRHEGESHEGMFARKSYEISDAMIAARDATP